jgi:hypothetical protein
MFTCDSQAARRLGRHGGELREYRQDAYFDTAGEVVK